MAAAGEFRVIVLWGDAEVSWFYDYAQWTVENARKILDHVEIYDFDTFEESEAFRMGLCAVKTPSARDFTEIAERSYRALLELASPPERVRGRRRAA